MDSSDAAESQSWCLDAHVLLASDDPAQYPPNPLGPPLTPEELDAPLTAARLVSQLDALHIERVVAVQRGRIYGFDNSYVCDMAALYPRRISAVCSIDTSDPHSGERALYWVKVRGAAGVRFMEPVKGSDLGWLDGAGARQVWRVAAERQIPVAVHFFPWNRSAGMTALLGILAEFPRTPVVLDNLSGISLDALDFGVDDLLRRAAQHPCVFIKFTMITMTRLEAAGLLPSAPTLIKRILDLFGAQRMMWGSDVLPAGCSYSQATQRAIAAVAGCSERERRSLLHDTAASLYPLE